MKYRNLTNNEKDILKELNNLKKPLENAIEQLKNKQGFILTDNWLMVDIASMLGMTDVEVLYNDNSEMKYRCRFPLWF